MQREGDVIKGAKESLICRLLGMSASSQAGTFFYSLPPSFRSQRHCDQMKEQRSGCPSPQAKLRLDVLRISIKDHCSKEHRDERRKARGERSQVERLGADRRKGVVGCV